jgi:hypothetical protein
LEIESNLRDELEFESIKNKALGLISFLSPVAAILIPGGLIADILISGGLVSVTEKFGNPEQEMSLTDLIDRLENLIVWVEFLRKIAQDLAIDSNFLNLAEKTKNQDCFDKQFNKIRDDLVISLDFNNKSILTTQIKKLEKSQKDLEFLEKNFRQIVSELEEVTNEDFIISIITILKQYFGNTVFAIEWLDDENGLIISYGQNTKTLIEIIQDCIELKQNIHIAIEKVNHLLIQAEQSLKKFEIQSQVNLSNQFTQPQAIQFNKTQTNQQSNHIHTRIFQVLSLGLFLGCAYVIGLLTSGNINQVPQNYNRPSINSK